MWVELCVSSALVEVREDGPPRRYGMSIGVLQANDLGGTRAIFTNREPANGPIRTFSLHVHLRPPRTSTERL